MSTSERKPMKRSVYACTNCNTAYHHHLQYCPRCPGRLVKRELPWNGNAHPRGWFEGKDGDKQYTAWLKENGLKLWKGDRL